MNYKSLYIANEGRRVATQESMDLKDRRSSLLEALIHVRSASDSQSHKDTLDTLYCP